ncbi:MAG: class I lanthipeptide [Myxococcales bacterium]|nr:class I lanthipeptide [Myxococcales bacterium]
MDKKTKESRKLQLSRQTLRALDERQLEAASGGGDPRNSDDTCTPRSRFWCTLTGVGG